MNLAGRYVNLKLNVSLPGGGGGKLMGVGASKIVSKREVHFLKKMTSFPCTYVKLPVDTEVSTIVISNYDKN